MNLGGLLERDWAYIVKTMEEFPKIQSAVLFGSRALGNYKRGSDIDLALVGALVNHDIVVQVSDRLNEVHPIPYRVDVLSYQELSNERLKQHIDAHGVEFYQKV